MFKLKPKLPFAVVISKPPNENKVDQKITDVLCLIFKLKKPDAKSGPYEKFGPYDKNRTMTVVRTLPFFLSISKLFRIYYQEI